MSTETFTVPPAPAREPGRPAGESGKREPRLERIGRVPLTTGAVVVALLAMLGASVWLRTVALHFYYWIDEGISVGIASHPLSHIPSLMREDGSPPLYYLILHLWMAWRGHSEIATHELSLIFALLTIPVAYWAGASLFNRRTGLASAFLAAGTPYLTAYAQETRMYSLVALLSLLVAASFVHSFIKRRRRYLALFTVSLVATMYSHNWGLFLAVIAVLAFLWCVYLQPEDRRGLWRDGLIGFGAVAVLFLPSVPTLLYQVRHTGAPWDLPPVVWSLSQAGYFLAGGRGVAMLLLLGGGAGLLTLRARAPHAAALTASPESGGRWSLRAVRTWLRERPGQVGWTRLAAESLLILGLGTLLLAWAYSKHSPAWADRYLAVIVGPLILLFGLGLARGGRLAAVAVVLTACFWLLDPVPHNLNTKSNVASVAAQLRSTIGANALVLSTQPEQVPVLSFYLPAVEHWATPLGPVSDPHVVDWRNALEKLRASSVHAVLGPMIDKVKPGEKVVLITPVRFPTSPEWMALINTATARWGWFLSHDPDMRELASSNAYWYDAGVNVEATVYQRR